jgi:hypothetical protein
MNSIPLLTTVTIQNTALTPIPKDKLAMINNFVLVPEIVVYYCIVSVLMPNDASMFMSPATK